MHIENQLTNKTTMNISTYIVYPILRIVETLVRLVERIVPRIQSANARVLHNRRIRATFNPHRRRVNEIRNAPTQRNNINLRNNRQNAPNAHNGNYRCPRCAK